jgi:mono/diheme cytochrome c family protein
VRTPPALLLVLPLFLAGCTLAGDITPPPDLATAQAGEPLPATASQVTAEATLAPVATQASAITAPTGIDPARGQPIWFEKCAPCHGTTGQSDGTMVSNLPSPPPKLGDPALAHEARPADWYDIVTNGRIDRLMPAFASLSDADRWNVVAFALTLSRAADDLTKGEALYAANGCAACHGDAQIGAGAGPSFLIPGLVEQRSLTELAQAIRAGSPPAMPAFAGQLTEVEVWELAGYVRSLAWNSLSTQAPATQAAVANGVIRGKVTNGTPGGSLPDGLQVTLSGFDGDAEAYSQTADLASDGTFAFADVPAVAGRIYGATVSYGDVLYFSEGAHLTGDGKPLDLPITVFETATDPSGLRVERLHVLFDFSIPEAVQVLELWVLSNESSLTIVAAPQRGAVEVTLPEGATELAFEDGSVGDRYILTETGFGDTQPIVPGTATSQFIFSYRMPYNGRLSFRQPTNYAINAAVVLLPSEGVTAKGTGLQDLGVQQMGGQAVRDYSAGAIAAGAALEFEISGRPRSAATGTAPSRWTNVIIGLGVLGGLLILAGLWWFRPSAMANRRRAPRPVGEDETDRLLGAIAELDDAFTAGKLDGASYRARREDLKRALRERMR